MSQTEVRERSEEVRENWIDWSIDCATIAVGEKWFCNAGEDADGWLGPDLRQGLVDWRHPVVVNDLGVLHDLAGSDIEPGHIATNVGISDDGENPARHVEKSWKSFWKVI